MACFIDVPCGETEEEFLNFAEEHQQFSRRGGKPAMRA